jgi:hypothetical protein
MNCQFALNGLPSSQELFKYSAQFSKSAARWVLLQDLAAPNENILSNFQ